MINPIKCFAGAAVVGLGFANCLAWANAKNVSGAEPAPTKVVAYGDLNLDSDTGVKTLYARLRAASRDVCVGLEGTDVMEQRIVRARCYSAALSRSVAQVNNAALSRLYNRSPTG
jgi:UrcA family protein